MRLLDEFGRELIQRKDDSSAADTKQRTRLIEEIAALPLMDATYLHVRNNRSLHKIEIPHIKDIFPNQSGAQIVSAYEKACRLFNDSYEFGDKHIASKFTNGREVLKEMARRHPGFSDKTYYLALSDGCAAAR